MKIKSVNLKDLRAAEYNPRKISEKQLDGVIESLKEFGLLSPLIVNENPERFNTIIGGHQRAKAWGRLGNKKIDVVYLDLDYKQERRLNLKLNKTGGEWDFDLLKEWFNPAELAESGFEDHEIPYLDKVDFVDLNPDQEPKPKKLSIPCDADQYDEAATLVKEFSKRGHNIAAYLIEKLKSVKNELTESES